MLMIVIVYSVKTEACIIVREILMYYHFYLYVKKKIANEGVFVHKVIKINTILSVCLYYFWFWNFCLLAISIL